LPIVALDTSASTVRNGSKNTYLGDLGKMHKCPFQNQKSTQSHRMTPIVTQKCCVVNER